MKQHPFTLSYQELKTSGNFDRQNEKNVRNLFPEDKESSLTNQALEEKGSIDPLTRTSVALNEEGGSGEEVTSLALGEEGGEFPPEVIDVPRYPGSNSEEVTSLALGEEGGEFPPEVIDVPRYPGSNSEEVTSLALGEEGGEFPPEVINVPRYPGSSGEEVTSLAIGEEGGDFPGEIDPLGGAQDGQNHLFPPNPIID